MEGEIPFVSESGCSLFPLCCGSAGGWMLCLGTVHLRNFLAEFVEDIPFVGGSTWRLQRDGSWFHTIPPNHSRHQRGDKWDATIETNLWNWIHTVRINGRRKRKTGAAFLSQRSWMMNCIKALKRTTAAVNEKPNLSKFLQLISQNHHWDFYFEIAFSEKKKKFLNVELSMFI